MVKQLTLPGHDKQADFRFAEPVNGLHRVADQKKRASVTVTPAVGEFIQQVNLAGRGILKLIYQQMLYSIVQTQCQITGCAF